MSDPQPNHFGVAPQHNFGLGLPGQPGLQQQMNALGQPDQQPHLQGLDQRDPRQMWSQLQMNHQLAGQADGGLGQRPMNAMMELFRNNPQFQQAGQQQGQSLHQHTSMQQIPQIPGHQALQGLSVPQANPMQNHPSQPAFAQQQQQQQQQQMEQLLRSGTAGAPPYPLVNRRMAISGADAGAAAISRQLQLLTDGSGIRPVSNGMPNRPAMNTHQPQPPGQPFMNPQLQNIAGQNGVMNAMGSQNHSLFPGQPVNQPHNPVGQPKLGPSPHLQPQQANHGNPTTYAQCVQRIAQIQETISRDEQEIVRMTNARPEDPMALPTAHQRLQHKKQVLNGLQHMLNTAPWPDRPGGPQQPGRASAGPPPTSNGPNSQQQPWQNPQNTGYTTNPLNTAMEQQLLRLQSPMRQQQQGATGLANIMPNQPNPQQQQSQQQQQQNPQPPQPQRPPSIAQHPQQQPNMGQPPPPQTNPAPPGFHAQPFMNHIRQTSQGGMPEQMTAQQQHQLATAAQARLNPVAEMAQQLQNQQLRIPPLEKTKFETTISHFYQRNLKAAPVNPVEQQFTFEGRTFVLWDLHREVMQMGSAHYVNAKNLWPTVGAKLGFAQQGAVGQLPRSSDQIAETLKQIHIRCLAAFENAYLQATLASQKAQMAGSSAPHAVNAIQSLNMAMQNPIQIPGVQQSQVNSMHPTGQPPPSDAAQFILQQQRMQHLMQYANLSTEQMRAQGLNENLIDQVNKWKPLMERQIKHLQQQRRHQMAGGIPPGGNVPGAANAAFSMSQPGGNVSSTVHPGMQNMVDQAQMPFSREMVNGTMTTNGMHQLPTGAGPVRVTPEDMSSATELINQMRNATESSPSPNNQPVPDTDVPEWRRNFEIALRLAAEVDKHLTLYFAIFKDHNTLRKLVAYVTVVNRQRDRFATTNIHEYLMSADTLKGIVMTFEHALNRIREYMQRVNSTVLLNMQQRASIQQHHDNNAPHPSGPPTQHPPQPQVQSGLHPNPQQPQHPPQHLPQPQHPHSEIPRAPSAAATRSRTPVGQPQANVSISKNARAKTAGAVNTPSPSAAVATPAATPAATASSPKTPKSPGKKASTKKPAAPKKKGTAAAAAAAAAPTPSTQAAPSPSQPVAASHTPESIGKRSREQDDVQESKPKPATLASEQQSETPPQKRPKLNGQWEAPPPGAAAPPPFNIKAEMDIKKEADEKTSAQVFAELEEFMRVNPESGLEQLTSGLSTFENLDPSASSSAINATFDPTAPTSDVFEFFDFVQYEDDGGTIAPTPDLVAATSTGPSNCSPESAADSEAGRPNGESGKALDASPSEPKTEKSDGIVSFDSSAAFLGELDPAIPQYFAFDEWNWSGPMQPGEWAISTN